MDKRTPSLRGDVLRADTTGPAVARVGTRGKRVGIEAGGIETPDFSFELFPTFCRGTTGFCDRDRKTNHRHIKTLLVCLVETLVPKEACNMSLW